MRERAGVAGARGGEGGGDPLGGLPAPVADGDVDRRQEQAWTIVARVLLNLDETITKN